MMELDHFRVVLAAFCIGCAVMLAWQKKEGWGWFLLVAVMVS